jgi:hypothetical protein
MQQASKREECYAARDTYFKCLESQGSSADECRKLLGPYEAQCPGSWRSYFNQQRERQTMLEMQADISRQRVPPTA